RISIASIPPSAKKNPPAIKYNIAIFLWSTVVMYSQIVEPIPRFLAVASDIASYPPLLTLHQQQALLIEIHLQNLLQLEVPLSKMPLLQFLRQLIRKRLSFYCPV